MTISESLRKIASTAHYIADNTKENKAEANKLMPEILKYISKKGEVTMDNIYSDLDCGDIPMYLALHNLVKDGKIEGDSPYEKELGNHKKYKYTLKQK